MQRNLFDLLQSSMAFRDALEGIGLEHPIAIRLSRPDGLRLLGIAAGCDSPFVEYLARGSFATEDGVNSLDVSGVTCQWPTLEASATADMVGHAVDHDRPGAPTSDASV
jgi:hypothetical protein